MPPAPPTPPDRGAVARRDAGLRRVSRLTRWLLAGALTLTAAFSVIAARTLPGQSGDQTTSSTSSEQSTQASSSESSSSDSDQSSADSAADSTLQSPASTPSASAGSGSVTSGGS